MNFFQKQEQARKKTKLFIFYFALCVLCIILGVYFAVIGFYLYLNSKQGVPLDPVIWAPDLFCLIAGFTLVVVLLGSLYKIISLASGGKKVAELVGGKKINTNTKDPKERQILNIVEEMAIASGTPVPAVYLLEEEGINAFAAGLKPNDAVIGVTRGTVEHLSRDELQGVIAHEFSHIFNGDMRMNIRLMGVLHGILLIALIGHIFLRTRGRRNPFPSLGLVLIVVGYAGIFFGRLIKAAVSRQREFLADASAVQYTRNPDGIAGALKKIGGWAKGSRIRHVKAEEASHFYFGNGLRKAWLQGLATHPPLVERIKRIDPQFDGKFPKVVSTHAKKEGVTANRGTSKKGKFPWTMEEALESIGNPGGAQLLFATALLEMMPAKIKEGLQEPFVARAVVYALLLDKEEGLAKRQKDLLKQEADFEVYQELEKMEKDLKGMGPEARLPMIDLAIPALKDLSKSQYERFRNNVTKLVEVDQRIDLFEFVLEQILLRHLDPHFGKSQKEVPYYYALHRLREECILLLSALAHFGNTSPSMAKGSFEKGAARLPLKEKPMEILPKEFVSIAALGKALKKLTSVSIKMKGKLLEACAACITADGEVTVEESELLRAIADAFDAPMPPVVVN